MTSQRSNDIDRYLQELSKSENNHQSLHLASNQDKSGLLSVRQGSSCCHFHSSSTISAIISTMRRTAVCVLFVAASAATAFNGSNLPQKQQSRTICQSSGDDNQSFSSRRAFLASSAFAGIALVGSSPESAEAIGPVKIDLTNPKYTAAPCPKVRKTR